MSLSQDAFNAPLTSRSFGLSSAIRWSTLVAAALLTLAYVLFFAQLKSLPLQDLPNHLARAHILDDLIFNGGARFGHEFMVHLTAIPYVLHDLVLTVLVHFFGTSAGAALFLTITLLSLPCALLLYMRATAISPRVQLPVFVLSLVLSTDWFFLMGFLAFRLAVAFVILSLAIAENLRARWSLPRYAGYLAVVAAGYLMHLSAPVFFGVVITVSAAARLFFHRSAVTREALLVLPVVALVVLNVAMPHAASSPNEHAQYLYEQVRLTEKVTESSYELWRFGGRVSMLLIAMLWLCMVLGCLRAWRWRYVLTPAVVENLLIAVAFMALYVLLPRDYADAAYVDIRALVMITIFLLIASAWLSDARGGIGYGSLGVTLFSLAVVAMNLGWIAYRIKPLEHWVQDYRKVVASVPVGARVLPVTTQAKVGLFDPFLHAGSYLVLDRNALMPYLFSGNGGDPMKFFVYRQQPYMPHESWYPKQRAWQAATPATYNTMGQEYTWRFKYSERDHVWEPAKMVPVDWPRVACNYEWMLVAKPFDGSFIGVRTELKTENDSAALLAIDRSACRPSPPKGPVTLQTEH